MLLKKLTRLLRFFKFNTIRAKISFALFFIAFLFTISMALVWFSYNYLQPLIEHEERITVFSVKLRGKIDASVRGLMVTGFNLIAIDNIQDFYKLNELLDKQSRELESLISNFGIDKENNPNIDAKFISLAKEVIQKLKKIAETVLIRLQLNIKRKEILDNISSNQKAFTDTAVHITATLSEKKLALFQTGFQKNITEIFELTKSKGMTEKEIKEKVNKIIADFIDVINPLSETIMGGGFQPIGKGISLGNDAFYILKSAGERNHIKSLEETKVLFARMISDTQKQVAEITDQTARDEMTKAMGLILQNANEGQGNSIFDLRKKEIILSAQVQALFEETNKVIEKFSQELDAFGEKIIVDIRKEQDILKYTIQIIKLLMVVVFIILLSSFIAGQFYIQLRVVDRIQEIAKALKNCAAGDLSSRVIIDSSDEISGIGAAYNYMAKSLYDNSIELEKSQLQLKQHLENLEEVVEERTKDLAVKNQELERTNNELRSTQSRLVSAEKLASLGALTAGIAHEIKNPLNFVINFSDLTLQSTARLKKVFNKYEDSFQDDDKLIAIKSLGNVKENLSTIIDQAKRADAVINRMLEHSRTQLATATLKDVNAFLDELINFSYHTMMAQNPSFNIKIEKKFDETAPLLNIVAPDMSRVFLNLLNNAYYSVVEKKEASNELYSPLIVVETILKGNNFEIHFWDNGNGIPKEAIPKIFTPFYTSKPPGEGTGLGLSLSHEIIVQEHHGSLTFETKEGEFAEFIIRLPIPPT